MIINISLILSLIKYCRDLRLFYRFCFTILVSAEKNYAFWNFCYTFWVPCLLCFAISICNDSFCPAKKIAVFCQSREESWSSLLLDDFCYFILQMIQYTSYLKCILLKKHSLLN